MIVLYILLFILCLSTLIAIHELGHLATAKIFKVYCFEYALGFGPKLFSRKRKNGTECILCTKCINECPKNALRLTK